MEPSTHPPVLEVRGLSKAFPGTLALERVGLSVRAHEVHALIGENGAGKSTLMRILAGALAADEGELLMDGQPVKLRSLKRAFDPAGVFNPGRMYAGI